ncbi:asparagine synthase (glutamine-hydrolyzing) [Chryseobacterium caseinilyticum]|uniref:asparagine synthase (glutamine-hydrolyzing) n=1 Tax=Chryseobacterium caseinilyticum TaxID=2771428 RepID=A0ABR8ZH34_9FLAO|nr:asparagine synthase (glutamine-hydrolyzing) [Chryseobacterium caseinilyticum]MBD8084620.1 asparagine synthase (glutamine-hydrolyzing) [Chryseobacterium caseinilyticum]
MCGINGIIKKYSSEVEIEKKLQVMNQRIIHRGPDEDGFFIHQVEDTAIGFAMRRLSIIDLSSGKQPIFTEDKSKVIVFNGEIYNYKVLKTELESLGIIFHTTSDTEVILKMYEKYGTNSFSRLDGMFAFSIYDKTSEKIFIVRDFFGEKPLYYTNTAEGLIWASELKSIMPIMNSRPEIDKTGLSLYFQLTYIPAPYSIYEGISKLEADHYIEYDLKTHQILIQKVNMETKAQIKEISFATAKDEVHDLVQKSVISRSVSDVPIGTFLSGGVDSSIVSWCLAKNLDEKINTFSIGFEKKSFDETDKSKTVAKLIGSNHHEFIISEKDLTKYTDEILLNFDEPFADSSALPSFLVAKKTSGFVKVALTGDGGDEIFGGYNKYLIGNINKRYTGLVPEKLHKNIVRFSDIFTRQKEDKRGLKFKIRKSLHSLDYGNDFYYNIIKLGFSNVEMGEYFKSAAFDSNPLLRYKQKLPAPLTLSDFREVDRMISLEGDMIVKVDRTSMLTSLECRAPFLNKELWNYTKTLPEEYLMKGSNKKYILKKAFEEYFPEEFLDKSKQGFGVPVGDWLKYGMRKELESFIDNEFLKQQDLFKVDAIVTMVKNHLSSLEDHSFKVWTFYCFQKWYKNIYAQL